MRNNGDEMKALVLTTSTRNASVEDVPHPIPKPGEVLIRVKAIALNPVDQIYVSTPIATQEKRVIGTDFAGAVVEASPELGGSSDPRTKPGTRIAGFLQGGEFRVGKLDERIPHHLAA